MKKIIVLADIFLILLVPLMIINYQPETIKSKVDSQLSYVNSEVFTKEIIEEVETEEIEKVNVETEQVEVKPVKEKATSTPKVASKVETPFSKEPEVEVKEEQETKEISAFVGDKFVAKMSGYGSDIGAYTAYGYCIKETIFYSDKTYGNLRILAAGYEYPFGTIIKVSGSKEGSFNAIVLDRGPNIGRGEGKKFAFDLLYKTSSEAYQHGVSNNVHFEVLRVGWK